MESNLLSGKQYVASEPPVSSDTSDTEGKFHFIEYFNDVLDMKTVLLI